MYTDGLLGTNLHNFIMGFSMKNNLSNYISMTPAKTFSAISLCKYVKLLGLYLIKPSMRIKSSIYCI